jgi:hypothetical protein
LLCGPGSAGTPGTCVVLLLFDKISDIKRERNFHIYYRKDRLFFYHLSKMAGTKRKVLYRAMKEKLRDIFLADNKY